MSALTLIEGGKAREPAPTRQDYAEAQELSAEALARMRAAPINVGAVSPEHVRAVRASLATDASETPAPNRTFTTKHGTKRDAILYGVGANSTHGLPRTNADKRHAVEMLLQDEEWAQWSDSEIARRCAVCRELVAKSRPSHVVTTSETSPKTYITKHGTEATMRTENIDAP